MQHDPPKRWWYPTITLHPIITQKTATWISIQAPLTSPWKWRQNCPPKRCHPTTSLYGVITQKTTTWISIQASLISPWRWRENDPLKWWYPTTSLHGVTSQKNSTIIFTAVITSNIISESDNFLDGEGNGRMILKWILTKWAVKRWAGTNWLLFLINYFFHYFAYKELHN
jgi:hypothetical protein